MRKITPYKGGRTVELGGSRATPETKKKLDRIKARNGESLGDLIERWVGVEPIDTTCDICRGREAMAAIMTLFEERVPETGIDLLDDPAVAVYNAADEAMHSWECCPHSEDEEQAE